MQLSANKKIKQTKHFKYEPGTPFELDQDIKSTDLKLIEKKRMRIVYDQLAELEQEESSDDDSTLKKYMIEINQNANSKKMDIEMHHRRQSIENIQNIKNKSKLVPSIIKSDSFFDNHNDNNSSKIQNKNEIKISKKGLRKMLRNYISLAKYGKEEIDQMIWEVDEDMDGKVSKYEMEKMYKRCIVDEHELEPKRLFYFIRFLMFDKEKHFCINEEDTLEILRARNETNNDFDQAILEIFNYEIVDSDGKSKIIRRDQINFEEFLETMYKLVFKKRETFKDQRINYCDYIKK
jgi:hypothetical protein